MKMMNIMHKNIKKEMLSTDVSHAVKWRSDPDCTVDCYT